MPGLLTEMGYDAAALMAEAQLDPALFDDPDNTVPMASMGRFLALCAARMHCPHLGLLLGARNGVAVLGVVGRLATCSADLGSALRNIILYLHLHDRGAIPDFFVRGDRASLVYAIHEADVMGTELIYDGALAIACSTIRDLVGPAWAPSEVRLTRAPPVEIAPYQDLFGARLRFDAHENAVVFSSRWLDHPLRGADAAALGCLLREIERLEAEGAGSLSIQLQRVLHRLFISGGRAGEPSMDHIANLFTLHRRTLNRRLRAEGTTFKALVDATRYDIARQLLRDTGRTTLEVAMLLGYADVTAFTRAFRRWSGISPAAWRATAQAR
ncbi:AraC family transcriptional regulator ligand-binding domain-containing protein [Thiococcus pfennigii]|uniref:AraC family transcriptional regulator ligand-binding domain-containing protein n=1 Tax=Thiococcus pfennigii TaxID=1057 RepID=UPI00190875EA